MNRVIAIFTALILLLLVGAVHGAESFLLQVEDFAGPWKRQTNIDEYLGESFCVSNAPNGIASTAMETTVRVKNTGHYYVWVRAFSSANSKRALQAAVNGRRLKITHDQTQRRWSWQLAGSVDLSAGEATLAIHDAAAGFECADAVYLTDRKEDNPATNPAIEPRWSSAATGSEIDPLGGKGPGMLNDYLMEIVHQQYVQRRRELEESLKSADALAARQKRLREDYFRMIGPWPEKTPLDAQVTGSIECDGYRIEKVVYQSRPGHRVTANLYLPTKGKPPFRAVLVACGHSLNGKAYDSYQPACILLARNGMVALIYDPISQGERHQQPGRSGTASHTDLYFGAILVGRSVVKYEAWDGIRSIDYLLSRPEVDPDKPVGMTGNSGGGTQTTFLMALDDRIGPAAPSCYLMTRERKFITRTGPADGCQHLPFEGARGIDHADYILMRAPRPTRVLAADKDYFDIDAVREASNEAKRAYTVLGCPERMDLFSYDDKHGFSQPRREQACQWMRRWLLDDAAPVAEPEFKLQPEKALWATETGQVATSYPDEVSVGELNMREAERLAATRKRFWTTNDKKTCLAEVRRLTGVRDDLGRATVESQGTVACEGYAIERLLIRREAEMPVPALLWVPEKYPSKLPATLYIDGRGKRAAVRETEKLVQSGRIVLSIDARGWGETSGEDYRVGILALHVGRPLLGQRVEDVLTALDVLAGHDKVDARQIDLIGVGPAGPVALHAAALDDRFVSLTLKDSIHSWVDDVVAQPRRANVVGYVVPSALLKYDLPDLLAILPESKLTVVCPGPAKDESSHTRFRGELRVARENRVVIPRVVAAGVPGGN